MDAINGWNVKWTRTMRIIVPKKKPINVYSGRRRAAERISDDVPGNHAYMIPIT